MQSTALTPNDYYANLSPDRKLAMDELRKTINKNIPKGFAEVMNYGMPGWVVPHALYPAGYHCDPSLPLPFVAVASQKNFIALYHMGIYSSSELLDWFLAEYPKHTTAKLDMGKSCIRFKKPGLIPFKLIGELMTKMSAKDCVKFYEKSR